MAAAGPHATSTVPVRPRTRRVALIAWRFGPAVLLMAVIWWLSAQPHLQTDLGWIDMVLRKCAHVTEFALLTLLWARALRWGTAPARPWAWPPSAGPAAGWWPRRGPRAVDQAGSADAGRSRTAHTGRSESANALRSGSADTDGNRGAGSDSPAADDGWFPPTVAIVGGAAIAFAWAVVDETHQHFVSGRVGSPRDVAIDSVGVLLAVAAWSAYHRARERR